ncbi:MAG: DNA repair protein RadA [Clostridiales Family XIII bacterium]|nr:DNA repair protein RadA [Clostridiales Family XIII bacterium]
MKKGTTVFVCAECGYESPKWMGQCVCGAWNSFSEERIAGVTGGAGDSRSRTLPGRGDKRKTGREAAVKLVDVDSEERNRLDTNIEELNRVLGGGIVKGSLILITGEPGVGKSTLILQAAIELAARRGSVLYVTGEESEEQIRLRADRLTAQLPESLYILSETNMEIISRIALELSPALLVIDSIQTMYTDSVDSAAGSISQVRTCTGELMRTAKVADIPVFLVAHVTKSGEVAGPKIIEHLVDCVLQFVGERNRDLRILRANKNRFGATSEIGAFEMREEGLVQIRNLSGSLLEGMEEATDGSAATAVYEGTRPLLLEMQALTAAAGVGFARRTALGVAPARLNMILAVLERKACLDLSNSDVYVNVVGGIRPDGTSVDLAVALALYSSAKSAPIPPHTLILGEIGLTGELRSVHGADKIVREAAKLGFTRVILPKKNADKIDAPKGVRLTGVSNVTEAIRSLIKE